MKPQNLRSGSVLIMALWIIAILSVMVISFAFEARQQAGIDIYVRERNRVNRIIDSGRVLGEAILIDYENVKDPEIKNNIPEWKDPFEEDRWCIQKWHLKKKGACIVGPICLEEEGVDYAEESDPVTLTVKIERETAASEGHYGVDINSFNENDDKNYIVRFQRICLMCGITEDVEVDVEDADRSGSKRHNLMNLLLSSWKDWRDEDTTVSSGLLTDSDYNPQPDDGAEFDWYKTRYDEDFGDDKNELERHYPPSKAGEESSNKHEGGPIKKIEELSYVRGFHDFPSVLYGGYLYDGTKWEEERAKERGTESNPQLTGLLKYFRVSEGPKIVISDDSEGMKMMLSTIPGLFPDDPEDDDAGADCQELIEAIVGALPLKPEDDDEAVKIDGYYPYKDWQDLCTRVEDYGCDLKIPGEIKEYIEFPGEGNSAGASGGKASGKNSGGSLFDNSIKKYKMTITGSSMGMKYTVAARCILDEKKVRYIEWMDKGNEDKK